MINNNKKTQVWLQFASLWSVICQPTAGKERQVTKLLGVKIILDFRFYTYIFAELNKVKWTRILNYVFKLVQG